ncbi:hypothetical protein SUGI_1133490 [Cryptomeria japonica]|uniref:uncharacterized protein LOC131036951 n=1 Tax=Cryptomeria japonica TaxID=3369 RepID=UPI002414706F|nr:uncharacterized protein LOC131036951 [Cryptomeria japonica]GLJ53189.1 hypothetical protein SUGI_1133490 [Cryptomeria japonica]
MSKIERAHQKYREGNHEEALQLYSEALELAKLNAHKIALHSNRAACHLKLRNFKKAAEECSAVLELDGKHSGALMLRAQTLVAMKDYHSALFDVHRLIELNPSSDAYRNLQARLRTQLSLAPIPEADEEMVLSDAEEIETPIPATQNTSVDGSSSQESQNLHSSSSSSQEMSTSHPKGWEAIPKPKGHSGLDYSRWDKVEIDSSDDEEDEDSDEPQYRFRLQTVGVRPVR